jgi:predicted metalloendopeptidase
MTPALAAPPASPAGVQVANMDKSARPGDDFYTYANGAWVKRTEIPADRASVGSFLVAFNTTEGQLNTLIAGILASNPAPGTDAQKIRDYYRAYLDTAAIDAKGMAPLKGDLARYAAIQSKTDLARVLGENLRADTDPLNATNYHTENLFGLFITQALKGGEVVPYLMQGGLGLPERDYYLSTDAKMVTIQGQYRAYIATILTDAGLAGADAQARADKIYDLEVKIAQAHESREESEDFQHADALWTRAQLAPRRRARLGRAAGRGRARLEGRFRRLSRQGDPQAGRPCRQRAHGGLEGLARLPSGQPICQRPAHETGQ